MLRGGITVEKDGARKARFEGRLEPTVTTANVDLKRVLR